MPATPCMSQPPGRTKTLMTAVGMGLMAKATCRDAYHLGSPSNPNCIGKRGNPRVSVDVTKDSQMAAKVTTEAMRMLITIPHDEDHGPAVSTSANHPQAAVG